jgi:hypothetical protein
MTAPRWHPFDLTSRILAERLRGREPSVELRAALLDDGVDWEGVVSQASEQFVLAAFAAAVRDLGLDASLDPDLGGFLSAVHAANVERNRQLRAQLAEVIAPLNRIGIEPVLLKGAVRLVDDLYPDLGWRMMWDLDVLVPEAGFASAIDALRITGYVATRAVDHSRKDVKLRRQGRANVEIHKELFGSKRQQRLLTGAQVISGSQPVAVDGATVRLPSTAHQFVHLIGHSQIGHNGYTYGRISLRDRLEAAAMVHWLPESLEWETVYMRFAAAGYRRPLLAFLLSLGDGGFCTVPVQARIDALTALQGRRIALQARSTVMKRVSLSMGWYAVLLGTQTMQDEARLPRLARTLKTLVLDREERRRMIRALIDGPPRPW